MANNIQQPYRNKNMGDPELDVAECGVSCFPRTWSPVISSASGVQAVLLDMASQLPLAQLRSLAAQSPMVPRCLGFVSQDFLAFLFPKGGSGWPGFFSCFLLLLQRMCYKHPWVRYITMFI